MGKRHGVSYQKRVADINRIYDQYVKTGVPNRKFGGGTYILCMVLVSVLFYNILNASADPRNDLPEDTQLFFKFGEE